MHTLAPTASARTGVVAVARDVGASKDTSGYSGRARRREAVPAKGRQGEGGVSRNHVDAPPPPPFPPKILRTDPRFAGWEEHATTTQRCIEAVSRGGRHVKRRAAHHAPFLDAADGAAVRHDEAVPAPLPTHYVVVGPAPGARRLLRSAVQRHRVVRAPGNITGGAAAAAGSPAAASAEDPSVTVDIDSATAKNSGGTLVAPQTQLQPQATCMAERLNGRAHTTSEGGGPRASPGHTNHRSKART